MVGCDRQPRGPYKTTALGVTVTMRVYMDMGFTGLHKNTTLVSIGLVSENNDTFYGEFNDYDRNQIDDWLQENVIDNLIMSPPPEGEDEEGRWSNKGKNAEVRGSTDDIKRYLESWFSDITETKNPYVDYHGHEAPPMLNDGTIQVYGDCMAFDWILFVDLWGHAFKVPSYIHYIPFDLCTALKMAHYAPDCDRELLAKCSKPEIVDSKMKQPIVLDNEEMCRKQILNKTGLQRKYNALFDAHSVKACWDVVWSGHEEQHLGF